MVPAALLDYIQLPSTYIMGVHSSLKANIGELMSRESYGILQQNLIQLHTGVCVCVRLHNCVCLVLLYYCMYHCVLDVLCIQRLSFNFVQTCKLHTYSTVCSNCIQVCNSRCYCRTTVWYTVRCHSFCVIV